MVNMVAPAAATLEHVALSANLSTNCFDAGPRDTFAFGCSNSLVLYQTSPQWQQEQQQQHNVHTYNYHKSEVTSVQWMRAFSGNQLGYVKNNMIISGDSNGGVVCSEYVDQNKTFSSQSLKLLSQVEGHSDSINSIDGVEVTTGNAVSTHYIASSGADSKIMIYQTTEGLNSLAMSKPQVIDFKFSFVLNVKFHMLPKCQVPVLACACDDFKIRLYAPDESGQFVEIVSLLGHEDWVRSISFVDVAEDSVLFSSTSQDCTVRMWKVELNTEEKEAEKSPGLLEVKRQGFSVGANSFSVSLDTVLESHEHWVYGAEWSHASAVDVKLQLLTASLDKTIILWEYDQVNNLWVDTARVGEVGGNTLGFYKAQFCNDHKSIVAHSYSGALYLWNVDQGGQWHAGVIITGHMNAVNDVDWEPTGKYLVSTSKDQTTRLFAKCNYMGKTTSWNEVARPQIHGFDMQCVAMLDDCHFVSGGDEKVVRVFQAPKNFLSNFTSLTGASLSAVADPTEAPEGASVPALGLSNKAVFTSEAESQEAVEKKPTNRNDQYIDQLFQKLTLKQPPSETDLLQNTLWPEVSKLYGHVYEIYTVAASRTGSLFATAARSFQQKHSKIFVWSRESWEEAGVLESHTLTVTQLEFSPDEKFILSVSRDRTWCLHYINRETGGKIQFVLVAKSQKKTGHSRILWSCSWSQNSRRFVTGSRDKKVMLWSVAVNEGESGTSFDVARDSVLNCGEPVTSVAFYKGYKGAKYGDVFAVGMESGRMRICAVEAGEKEIVILFDFGDHLSHCLAVQRIKWKPTVEEGSSEVCLASCSLDNQVKVFQLQAFD